ncbi:MAG: phosphoglucomutase [bacterium]
MSIIFGTDGWRGLIGEDINENSVCVAAQAFADYLLSKFPSPSVIIGYDNRNFSKLFADAFAEVLSGNDINSLVSDRIIPTPVVSFNVKQLGFSAGVMITASHNPAKYNGIKFKSSFGSPFFTEETQLVEELLYKTPIKRNNKKVKYINLFNEYLIKIHTLIDFNKIKTANIQLLVDSMGGAGQQIIAKILNGYCKVDTIYGIPSPDFYGRYAEPIEKNLLPLSAKLQENPIYSFGIANDGDADRIGIMLENGNWLSAQETIFLITDYLINKKKITGNLVKTSSVTDKLRTNFETSFRKVFDVQVGFKYIAEKMIYENIAFGCEESGGYGYANHVPERDGILSALIIAEMLADSGFFKLSEYVEEKRKMFGHIYYDRIDYIYEKENRTEILPNLYNNPPKYIADYEVKKVESFCSSRGVINGIKFRLAGNPRWLLIRASETEPLVRFYAEAEDANEVKEILLNGIKIING